MASQTRKYTTNGRQSSCFLSEAPYTSGLQNFLVHLAAGEPKAIPWTHVAPLRCAADSWANMDLHARDVLTWPTSLGCPPTHPMILGLSVGRLPFCGGESRMTDLA